MNVRAPNDIWNRQRNIQTDSTFVTIPMRQKLHNGDILLQNSIVRCEVWDCHRGTDDEPSLLEYGFMSIGTRRQNPEDFNLQH